MPTAPQYIPLARWTCSQITRFWPTHPRIFLCGAKGDFRSLPLRDDPRDWMKVVASACSDLLADGFEQAYLILDDHPPISVCHKEHLELTLPQMAKEFGMTSIVTGGYGPLNRRKGEVVKWKGHTPERLPLSQPWKLPLHPSLWNLQRLYEILLHLIERLPESDHTPWAFERIGSDVEKGGCRKDWLSQCWRVNALEMSAPEALRLHDFWDSIQRTIAMGCVYYVRIFKGIPGSEALINAISGLRHPRIGPYPCFWSGVMKKGKLNRDYMTYALIKKHLALTSGLEESFAACDALKYPLNLGPHFSTANVLPMHKQYNCSN